MSFLSFFFDQIFYVYFDIHKPSTWFYLFSLNSQLLVIVFLMAFWNLCCWKKINFIIFYVLFCRHQTKRKWSQWAQREKTFNNEWTSNIKWHYAWHKLNAENLVKSTLMRESSHFHLAIRSLTASPCLARFNANIQNKTAMKNFLNA